MIRTLFRPALPILGLGAAVVLLGPDMVTGPRGEPMVVAAPQAAALQDASFDGEGCALPLTLERGALPHDKADAAHMVTLAVRYGVGGPAVTIEKGTPAPDADAALVLLFDDDGRIVAVAEEAGCLSLPANPAPAGI